MLMPHVAVRGAAERMDARAAIGRVLAAPIVADRPSPPHDVSAMDGYAFRADDAVPGDWIPVAAEARMGQPPPDCPAGAALRVSTGANLPSGVDLVIRREDTDEEAERVRIHEGVAVTPGLAIRRAGENIAAGATVTGPGVRLTPGVAAAAATFGAHEVSVQRRVRVAVLVTGDEFARHPRMWQIRESNGACIAAWIAARPHLELLRVAPIRDTLAATTTAMTAATEHADLVITTGGVSMGDRDFVRPAAEAAGYRVAYHRIAMRPGKPNLGAWHPSGTVLLGLPGNPMSVLAGLARFVGPVGDAMAGLPTPRPTRVPVAASDAWPPKPIGLWQYVPARFDGAAATPILHRGSGDLAAVANTAVFLEVPLEATPADTASAYLL